jgi:hypothetical protein
MKNKMRFSILLIAAALLLTIVACDFTTDHRDFQRAYINGYVTNEVGTPISGADVVLSSSEIGTVVAVTGGNGYYSIMIEYRGEIPTTASQTDITASRFGYVEESTSIQMKPGNKISLNFALSPVQ